MKNRNDKIETILSAKSPAQRLSAILNHLMAESRIDGVQLSRRTGVPVTTINRLRKNDVDNNPTLSTLVPLANFFVITVSQLIGDGPEKSTVKFIARGPSTPWGDGTLCILDAMTPRLGLPAKYKYDCPVREKPSAAAPPNSLASEVRTFQEASRFE